MEVLQDFADKTERRRIKKGNFNVGHERKKLNRHNIYIYAHETL